MVEAIEKPGNLGTILRSADAAGCDAVIVCDPVTDIFNPNVVRASTGVLFSVPLVVAESVAVHAWLKTKKIRTIATTPAAETLYTAADLCGALAVVMGSEQYGLSEFWLKNSDLPVRIPMAGQADSLNVAMATIITLFEAVRQRSAVGRGRTVGKYRRAKVRTVPVDGSEKVLCRRPGPAQLTNLARCRQAICADA